MKIYQLEEKNKRQKADDQAILAEREAEKQRALEAAEAEKNQLKQRIHELQQQIALPKIKSATPPRLFKQALVAGIASLCSPPPRFLNAELVQVRKEKAALDQKVHVLDLNAKQSQLELLQLQATLNQPNGKPFSPTILNSPVGKQ